MAFAKLVRSTREREGLTQAELGARLKKKLSGAAISDFELDKSFPSPEHAVDLANALGIASTAKAEFLLKAAGYSDEVIGPALSSFANGVLTSYEISQTGRDVAGKLVIDGARVDKVILKRD